MAGTTDDAFHRATAPPTRAEMEAELKRLKLEREYDRRLAAPAPKLVPKGPGGPVQHGADGERMATLRTRLHEREQRIRVLELTLGKSSSASRGRSRRR